MLPIFSNRLKSSVLSFCVLLLCATTNCTKSSDPVAPAEPVTPKEEPEEPSSSLMEGVDYFLPNVSLNNWKVTLPIGNPTEVEPPEILDYATDPLLQKYMYNDSTEGALVFYTFPSSSTPNSSYSRTELREQMEPGSNSVNWTFAEGGIMRGKLRMAEVSKDASGKPHRTIIMQIHGRLTNEQRDRIGEDDNNAPPILKIYWNNGKVRVKSKILADTTITEPELLYTDTWKDDEGYTFPTEVGYDPFTLEIRASEGRMEVILNDEESLVFDDVHMRKWGVFENYFKAGNYLVSRDEGAYAIVKYYDLEVSH